ncbi:MAG: 30S ribosomal protein S8 [Hyphomicrobiales bacterium]|nr:30S ribosomal protein S8 [Hyphomicrobiales bacterium]
MPVTDPLSDMLTRIRNAQQRGHKNVRSPSSKLRKAVLDVLVSEGYIAAYDAAPSADDAPGEELHIELKYHEAQPVIRRLSRVSRPGRRVYANLRNMPMVHNGLGVFIISTPQGVMSDAAARRARLGGEILCRVF